MISDFLGLWGPLWPFSVHLQQKQYLPAAGTEWVFVCLFVTEVTLSKCRRAPSPDSAREQGATSRELGQSPMPGQPQ